MAFFWFYIITYCLKKSEIASILINSYLVNINIPSFFFLLSV